MTCPLHEPSCHAARKSTHRTGARNAPGQVSRRAALLGGSLVVAGGVGWPLVRRLTRPRASVFIASGQRYDAKLVQTIRDGLIATGVVPRELRGKRVLLKPNLVEPSHAAPHVTTHPAMILAAAEAFRQWDAEVAVGEGPGHVRDTQLALDESGVQEALDSVGLPFRDLNYEDVRWRTNAHGASNLCGLYLPRSVVEADVVVSLPKLKTHHWVGVTAAMKNLYGVIPGIRYGWPKNVLHFNGIPETVVDINAAVPKTLAVVDAITCMEGDGPIMGTPKPMGLVLVGATATAVDATACRLMRIEPTKIPYLALAADRLGPIDDALIEQRGEPWRPLAEPFATLDRPEFQQLRMPS
jgi:uncharacterized protein (DUF362 family)